MTSRTSGERPPGPPGSAAGGTSDPHRFERIALGPYRHRYDCCCSYSTDEVDNGTPTAGAQLVRHLAANFPPIPEENTT